MGGEMHGERCCVGLWSARVVPRSVLEKRPVFFDGADISSLSLTLLHQTRKVVRRTGAGAQVLKWLISAFTFSARGNRRIRLLMYAFLSFFVKSRCSFALPLRMPRYLLRELLTPESHRRKQNNKTAMLQRGKTVVSQET